MAMVKKRDGRKEPFIGEKIVVSAVKSGAPPDLSHEIARGIELHEPGELTSKEIRAQVLARLKAKNPEWERNWRVFDIAVKKRTE